MSDLNFKNPAALAALANGDAANAIAAATPGGIEAQEAAGQRDLTAQFKTLPKDMDPGPALAFGFVLRADADDIFVNVTAPAGWQLKPTEHSMHSHILDELGRKRGGVFYKAAFYDRRASGHWDTRYCVHNIYDDEYDVTAVQALDTATGAVLFEQAVPQGDEPRWERREGPEKAAAAWLNEHCPDWRDVTAYWNENTGDAPEQPTAPSGGER